VLVGGACGVGGGRERGGGGGGGGSKSRKKSIFIAESFFVDTLENLGLTPVIYDNNQNIYDMYVYVCGMWY
jgi:hypothetical protein